MDKNAIKKYAVWARRELIERVSQKALQYGIAADEKADPHADSVNGHLLSDAEKKQRQALIRKVEEQGYEQTIEEVAYTWFNRFAALRFMEVNGYFPSHVRVFTNEEGEFKPQILSEAIHIELDGLDMEKVYELKNANKDEELFKYLLIVQCNALNKILPRMFQKIEDYTELLLPDYLLREGSVIQQMIALIPEQDWMDQVQIIGWLYQYYNAEPKDKVFADLKKNIKITKENIPAATQLFTPDWIVRYMVENSLGRLWLEGHPDSMGKLLPSQEEREAYAENRENPDGKWMYYLEEAEQEADVQKQLDEIRKEYASMKPEEIRCIDPCMGSGHILCYLFDVLVQIYEDYGYTAREAVASIIEHNLWGLDIDERAAQLAYFAVMMKARQYDRRIFSRNIQPHVYAIEESNGITTAPMHDMGLHLTSEEYGDAVKQALHLVEEMHDAKDYGSIIHVTPCDWDLLRRFAVPRDEDGQMNLNIHGEIEASARLQKLINAGETLSQKYHVIVTNPPYMGNSGMNGTLADYVKKHYPDTKSDMSTVMMECTLAMAEQNGFIAMINIPVWMFLSSYEKLRNNILNNNTYINMVHPGRGIFGSDFGTTTFVIGKKHIPDYTSSYRRLFDVQGEVKGIEERERAFISGKGNFIAKQSNFSKIPGSPVAYWASNSLIDIFGEGLNVEQLAHFTASQNKTANNEKYLRNFWELSCDKIGIDRKWVFYMKGGDFRKHYGNIELVVDWSVSARNFYKNNATSNLLPKDYWFIEGITYTMLTSKGPNFRYMPAYCVFDMGGPAIGEFFEEKNLYYVLALLNSKITSLVLGFLNPTINIQAKDIKAIPILIDCEWFNTVEKLEKNCIMNSRADWDSFETSWDFARHPLLPSRDQVAVEQKSGMEDSKRDYTPEETEFAVFCIENVAIRLNVDASEVYDAFTKKTDLLDGYIIPCYDVLHTQGKEYIVNDLVDRLKEKGEGPRRDHLISGQYKRWQQECEDRFQTLKSNEEELNRIFIDIYGLQDELTPEEEDRDVTVRRIFDTKEEIPENMRGGNYAITKRDVVVSLISYAVGCMFGRYSLDVDGLAYAGGEWDGSKYKAFLPDKDAIIPICDDDYFDDDITGRFVQWVETVYGDDTLEENLRFIADAIGGNGTPRQVIRKYFMNDFYADHCKTYQKRPIYWLFDSGKKNGFKCLVYIHRYQPDMIARIRTDYVHEQQSRYRTAIADLEQRMNGASTSDRVKLGKQLSKLQDQADETREYEEKIHHLADQMIRIDLDDGVKHNYEIFKDVLAKIK